MHHELQTRADPAAVAAAGAAFVAERARAAVAASGNRIPGAPAVATGLASAA